MIVQDQTSVLAFLKDPANYGEPATRVTTTDTHISIIVFVGRRVFKLKRAVRLPYVDFSTAARRLAACRRELNLNRRTAPMLYVGVRRITRETDGSLLFDGRGELVDAVVEMIRFDENTLFDRMATRGQLTPALLTELSRTVARFHANALIDHRLTGAARIASVLDANERALAMVDVFAPDMIAALTTGLRAALGHHEALLNAREQAGRVRHCHGDLHLSNICLVDGAPTLFDCIEFDEAVATIDVLYDLAFVVMDLWRHDLKSGANLVFNRYFDERDEVDGLPLMSFFMALRATIRAHVVATQAGLAVEQRHEELVRQARAYIALAFQFLVSAPFRLVAIGGLSGTGKSTIAAAIADRVGSPPGARVLASDRIRKRLHGVPAEVRLPVGAYRPEVSEQVYSVLMQNAEATLANGYAVIVDAVFDRIADRERVEHIAVNAKAPFIGIWLHAQADALFARVGARRGDASDATAEVVRAQLANESGPVNWARIGTGGAIVDTVAQVAEALTRQGGANMKKHADWDPRSPEVLANPIRAYDAMRQRCPVAYSDYLGVSIFRHADVMRVLMDPKTFSSQASSHVSVPNSMDAPEHGIYRRLIEPYFNAARMAQFKPTCLALCASLAGQLPWNAEVEFMRGFAYPFALQMQCAFLGWPESLHEPLRQWMHKKNTATLSGSRQAVAAVATEFDGTIRQLLKARRDAGDNAPDDATTRLMRETVQGRSLTEEEIVSILRNWTVGELGTIASSVGIIAYYLAAHPELQQRLRGNTDLIRAANDEILRIHAPLIANRRVATRTVRLGNKTLQAGDRVTLMWASANRDEAVFGDPDEFRLDRNPGLNLLYGAGVHACPGAPLARMELESIVKALLAHTGRIETVPEKQPIASVYPSSGYRALPLRIVRHPAL